MCWWGGKEHSRQTKQPVHREHICLQKSVARAEAGRRKEGNGVEGADHVLPLADTASAANTSRRLLGWD